MPHVDYIPHYQLLVTLKDPIERGLKEMPHGTIKRFTPIVTLKDPIERGLKAYSFIIVLYFILICYTQRPDRKGTERLKAGV